MITLNTSLTKFEAAEFEFAIAFLITLDLNDIINTHSSKLIIKYKLAN